jgi:hypothetical protein|tara:strand:- start:619 stop:813 length:195 start_codon:yes stop_codon:yes gene_type:complete
MPLDLPLNYATEDLPPVSKELILWLKQVYPDRMPDKNDTLETIRYKQGCIAVVKTLTSIQEEQE